jgi:aspartate aminotransferase
MPPPDPRLLLVCGKGGVGRTTVATALALGLAREGRRVLVAEVAAKDDVARTLGTVGSYAEKAVADRVHHVSIDPEHAMDEYLRAHKGRLQERLDRLHQGFSRMAQAGLPVRDIAPQGAIYLSVQFDLIGKRGLRTNDQVRKYLLDEAGFAVVPFQAFGLGGENGWFRLSVGAVSLRDIDEALPRVEAALRKAAS